MSPDEYELNAIFNEEEGDCGWDEERMGDENEDPPSDDGYEDDHPGLYGSEW